MTCEELKCGFLRAVICARLTLSLDYRYHGPLFPLAAY